MNIDHKKVTRKKEDTYGIRIYPYAVPSLQKLVNKRQKDLRTRRKVQIETLSIILERVSENESIYNLIFDKNEDQKFDTLANS